MGNWERTCAANLHKKQEGGQTKENSRAKTEKKGKDKRKVLEEIANSDPSEKRKTEKWSEVKNFQPEKPRS